MIYLYLNGMKVGTIPSNGVEIFLKSEEFQFWKKNCIEFENGKVVHPTVRGNYQGIEFSHAIEVEDGNPRISGGHQEILPAFKPVRRIRITKAG